MLRRTIGEITLLLQKNLSKLRNLATCFLSFILMMTSNSSAMSIQEYNQLREIKKLQEQQATEESWKNFLKNQSTKAPPKKISIARKATEDFLIASGGVKAQFAQALRQIDILPMTFERPEEESNSSRNGGFHRGQGSIFIDPINFNRTEWLKAFIHEGAHRLDDQMFSTLSVYNNKDYVMELVKMGQSNIDLSLLNTVQRKKLDAWLIAGLNRGFLGEYRAWLLTYVIYKEARIEGIIDQIDWLESLRAHQPHKTSDDVYIFRHLNDKWKDPDTNLFKYGFIQEALKELRQRFYNNPKYVNLGKIGEIINITEY